MRKLIILMLFLLFSTSGAPVDQVDTHIENKVFPEETPEITPFAPTIPDEIPVDHRGFCTEYNMYDNSPLTGFVDDWGFCVPGLVTNEVWFTKSLQYVYGSALFYSPGIMRATAKWRSPEMYNLAYRTEGYLGGVATSSPANIGDTVWMRRPGEKWQGRYLVVDCSRRADVYTHIAINQQVIEVDFDTALAWGLVTGDYSDWTMISGKEQTVEVWYGMEKPNENILLFRQPVYFTMYWLENVVNFQREKIEPSPVFYPSGLNPLWDLKDGNGRQCLTNYCLGLFNKKENKDEDQRWQFTDR